MQVPRRPWRVVGEDFLEVGRLERESSGVNCIVLICGGGQPSHGCALGWGSLSAARSNDTSILR